jgi:hypothetical protein
MAANAIMGWRERKCNKMCFDFESPRSRIFRPAMALASWSALPGSRPHPASFQMGEGLEDARLAANQSSFFFGLRWVND